jgi:hypothetical protein
MPIFHCLTRKLDLLSNFFLICQPTSVSFTLTGTFVHQIFVGHAIIDIVDFFFI